MIKLSTIKNKIIKAGRGGKKSLTFKGKPCKAIGRALHKTPCSQDRVG